MLPDGCERRDAGDSADGSADVERDRAFLADEEVDFLAGGDVKAVAAVHALAPE